MDGADYRRMFIVFVATLLLFVPWAGLRAETPEPAPQDPGVPAAEERPAPETKAQPAEQILGAAPLVAGWDNGFFLRSGDRQHTLRFTGQIQTDYRAFVNKSDTTDINQFLARRVRFGLDATMAQYYEFRLMPDFGLGQARIVDAFLNVHYWDAFQIEFGKFKQPFSYEFLIQDRFVPTMERSLFDQVDAARDVGLMIHGQKLFQDRLDYGVSISSGVPNGDTDTNNAKDVAARIAVRPFNSDGFPLWWRGLQLGVALTAGFAEEPPNPATLRTPASVPWLQFQTGVVAAGQRNRFSPELAYSCGPVGIAAQYLYETEQFRAAAAGPVVTVPMSGFYVLGTLLLTGEERTSYSQAIAPFRPFDARHPLAMPGAWELVLRTSRLSLNPIIFVAGPNQLVDPASYSNAATELTSGFNWYLNSWVRLQFNWERAWFDRPVRLGPGPAGLLLNQDTLMTRFQVIF